MRRFFHRMSIWGAATGLLVTSTGCSKSVTAKPVFPVEGQVLYEGRPIAGATVVFHPSGQQKDEIRPRGRTDASGKYTLSSFATGDGAPAGDYAVTVELWDFGKLKPHDEASPPAVNRLPARYARPESSGAKAHVEAAANQLKPIELKK